MVELDAAALGRIGDGGGVEVLDPDGARVDAERLLTRDDTPCRPVAVGGVSRDADTWTLVLDLGPRPEPHAALGFELEEAVLAAGCELEGSPDGRSWSLLARGDLFRLGEGATLARTRLAYAPTRDAKLRLRWPAAAGTPRVRAVEVCAPEPERSAPRLPVASEPLPPLGDGQRWRLPLPARAARVRALHAAREPDEAGGLPRLAWHLEFAQDGEWHELASGAWPAGERELRAPLGDAAFLAHALRLELWGSSGPAPRLAFELAPQRVRFVAARAGRFELRLPAPPRAAPVAAPSTGEAIPLEHGAPRLEPGPVPAGAPPGAGAPQRRFAARWPVDAASALASGNPVVLPLPPLDGIAAPDRSDVRLLAGGRLVPARVARAAEPAVARLAAGPASAGARPGISRIALELGDHGDRAVTLRLRAPLAEGAFRRGLSVRGRSGAGPGAPVTTLARTRWDCAPDPPRPCETELRLRAPGPGAVEIEIEDGDARPLGPLAVELESGREEAIFQWPGPGVELAAGAPGLGAARYDFAALDAALALARPVEVRLGPRRDADGGLERWSRPLLAVAVAAAALALLALLRRLLPKGGEGG